MPYKDLEKRKTYHKEYMRKHPQVLSSEQKSNKKVYMKVFSKTHKNELAEYQKHREKINLRRKIYRYKESAQKRELDFLLSSEEFNKLLDGNCHYCGVKKAWGVDRIDNKIGYASYNVVSCCKICNYMKRDLSYQDFINHIKNVSDNFT